MKLNEFESKLLIGSHRFTVVSDDDYLSTMSEEFEPHTVNLLRSLVNHDDVVLDVGANIGCTALLFGTIAKQVYAFEPAPSTFRYLQRNVSSAGLSNVQAVNAGLGESEIELEIAFSPHNRSGGFVTNKLPPASGHQVEKISIANGDNFLKLHEVPTVNFIKIDVEGFELEVIRGLRQTIQTDKPVVALEMNHWCLNVMQRISIPDFIDELRTVFPILIAAESDDYRNLHDSDEFYEVAYQHVVNGFKYPTVIGAFEESQLQRFMSSYESSPDTLAADSSLSHKERRTYERQIQQLQKELELTKSILHDTHNTKSWRLTEPLRRVKAAADHLKGN